MLAFPPQSPRLVPVTLPPDMQFPAKLIPEKSTLAKETALQVNVLCVVAPVPEPPIYVLQPKELPALTVNVPLIV